MVEALRRRLDRAGLYGTRASALVGNTSALDLPPYLATLLTSESLRYREISAPGDDTQGKG